MAHIARSSRQLGAAIQRARKQKGMSQTELAGLAGLRQELVSKIETGQEGTRLSSIYALFAALDLEMVIDQRSGKSAPDIEDIF
ncbi:MULTISPECIES: helix-turn-helix domain-containing protein [unclassified Sphingobium]|jgi:HTH-type transcriptional regulator / antitoxin HipB|uniref:helix-turn-helix domain-containing protein n=1 Tax=unclassified Sphingobium TaxID=2611147 RepID=UPI00044539EB|nr:MULTISPECIES: helix-turn-helix domain-containing protein [unclassified Sphingobium]EXS69549.1 XRE family transcriptional regulator [Sphingobium sp. Ant17]PBN44664.1 transcriptional regulator [Sphingobium sp. D43FB]|tara:strand:- start:16268 stop:16519 length:252 start_codon:yes stop_codon:yes gene_type:complete